MSLPVAIQSAIFYFLACTPCTKVRHRQRAKEQAKKEREDKARMEAAQPDLYRHPDPFSTNPYWTEEIMMGPSLPKKGKGGRDVWNKTASLGRLASTGKRSGRTNSSRASRDLSSVPNLKVSSPTQFESPLPQSKPTVAQGENGSSPTLSKTVTVSTADDWNRKRYQREDEELWGHDISRTGHKLMDAIKQAGTTAGRYVEAALGKENRSVTEQDRYEFYYPAKNPPVNDYHPPVVSSMPLHPDAKKWMLQPPPSAKVMEGKVPVSRSRSGSTMSAGSKKTVSAVESSGLGRMVGERAVENKLRNGETPGDGELALYLRPYPLRSTTLGTTRTKSQRTMRSRSVSAASTVSEDSVFESSAVRRRSNSVVLALDLDSEEEDEYISKSLEALSSTPLPSHSIKRPKLPTIVSADATKKGIVLRPMRRPIAPLREIANANLQSVSVSKAASPDADEKRSATAFDHTENSGLV